MKTPRLLTLFAVLHFLVLAACSQPEDNQSTVLESQFGTRGYDYAESVTYTKTRILYVLGRLDADERLGGDVFLRRYDPNGSMVWETYLNMDEALEGSSVTHGLATDSANNVYSAWSYDISGNGRQTKLAKYAPNGSLLWLKNVPAIVINIVSDKSGNLYTTSGPNGGGALTKYAPNGRQLWQRSVTGSPWNLAISSSQDLYVIRTDRHLEKYSTSGSKLWEKALALDGVFPHRLVAGVNNELYVFGAVSANGYYEDGCASDNYYLWLYKFSGDGVRQWKKNVSGAPTNRCIGASTDTLGNIYVSGSIINKNTGDADAFYAKYNRAGTTLMFKGFATHQRDIGRSITTYDGSELYVSGWTYGYLVHRNLGGSDAVLRKMDKNGNRIWTR